MAKPVKRSSKRAAAGSDAADASVELSEQDGVRFLHLGSKLVQSAMRLSRPHDLEIAYTRCMMAFLLFNPAPKDVLMVGLGGGSLAKFIVRHLPETRLTVVEISWQVVAAARSFFCLPAEGERFRIVVADGVEYVANLAPSCDLMLCDGYEDGALPKALASQGFYDAAAAALRARGMMVTNLLGRDRRLKGYIERIDGSFKGGLLRLEDEEDGNLIVIAFRKPAARRNAKWWQRRAAELEDRYGLPFIRYATRLLEQIE